MHKYRKTVFLMSAADISQAPPSSNAEVVFVGRSNSGKSSAINAITEIKGLAKTSKTPGRTQLINFFEVSPHRFLVDLPGYGYAKVARSVQKEWAEQLSTYVTTREQLRGIISIMDIRHPLTASDQQMLGWLMQNLELPIHILLTKADKLTRQAANKTLREVQNALSVYEQISVQIFSANSGIGLDAARAQLDQWLY